MLPLSEMQEILRYHNELRCKTGGSNVSALNWNEGLAQSAQVCVTSCPAARDPTDQSNVAFGHHTWSRAMDSWTNEEVAYNAKTKECMLGDCGQYLSMVNAKFDRLGCARSQGTICPKGGMDVLVCKYSVHSVVADNPDASVLAEGRNDMPNTACAWVDAVDEKPLEIPKIKLPALKTSSTSPRPSNCKGKWSSWSKCSSSCGGGNSQRRYIVTAEAKNGGEDCEASEGTQQGKICNHNPCPGSMKKLEALQAQVNMWKNVVNSTKPTK